MAIELPADNMQPEKQQEAAGGVGAAMAEIAGNIWKEMGNGVVAGALGGLGLDGLKQAGEAAGGALAAGVLAGLGIDGLKQAGDAAVVGGGLAAGAIAGALGGNAFKEAGEAIIGGAAAGALAGALGGNAFKEAGEAIIGGAAAGALGANQMKEVGEAIIGGAAAGAAARVLRRAQQINFQEVQINALGEGAKMGLNNNTLVLQRIKGHTEISSPVWGANPAVGWFMQFDKKGGLTASDGVKKIASANGIDTYRTRDGQTIMIDKHGPLKIKDDNGNVTSFTRGAEQGANAAKFLPKLELNKAEKLKDLNPREGKLEKLLDGNARPEKAIDINAKIEKLLNANGKLEKLVDPEAKHEKAIQLKKVEPATRSYETPFNGNGVRSATMNDGSTFSQFQDGTTVLRTADGTRTKLSPDGSLHIEYANGKRKDYSIKDSMSVLYKDGGSVGYTFPDGTHVILKNRIADHGKIDTGIVITRPNGASVETYSQTTARIDYTPAPPNNDNNNGIGKKWQFVKKNK